MATGNYGSVRLADVSPQDMQIFYNFTPNRDSTPSALVELDPTLLVTESTNPNTGNIFGGLYNLELPVSSFNKKGFYNIIIKPREISLNITDCGVLSSLPDIKGLVLNINDLPPSLITNNSLVGYRVEYLDSDGTKIRNFFRIITSSNRCEPVNQNLNNTTQKAIRYRLTENGNLIFLTLTPSSASNVRPNLIPFIGEANQEIRIINTFFNPVNIEVELVDQTIETLAHGIYGNQTKSIKDGVYTIYDNNNRIYKQYNLYEILDQFGEPLFEVREEKDNIDLTKNFNDITSQI